MRRTNGVRGLEAGRERNEDEYDEIGSKSSSENGPFHIPPCKWEAWKRKTLPRGPFLWEYSLQPRE